MAKKMLFMLILMVFTIGSSSYAMTSSNIDKLNQKSDEALQMVKINREDDALRLLKQFSKDLLSITSKENTFNMDELKAITAAYDGALNSLQTENTHDYKVNALTKLRLVVDAVSSNYRPLWTEMEESMMTTFSETQKAVTEKNSQQFNNELNVLLIKYDLIYYSLKVDVRPEKMQAVEAKFQYLDHFRPQILESASSQKELDELQSEMKAIFDEMKKDEADPSLWWVIISTGSIIISTLSYVGWRKYKGTKETVRSKNDSKR
ncbi:sporulation protein YpjB [Bacillus massiliigorillae]|uniref:sporulation protein YpjB n=1 Tax=Bacillus massiliigorillae TaxID=1243664 RepID=UPI0003A3E573|nr:sporulation protein YpjB [Bacillus massiliigorillae]